MDQRLALGKRDFPIAGPGRLDGSPTGIGAGDLVARLRIWIAWIVGIVLDEIWICLLICLQLIFVPILLAMP